jgi:hypothetical protein
MPQKFINIGNQSNDGTGDSIREAFSKVNNNFADLYDFLEAPTGFRFANLEDYPAGAAQTDPLLKLGPGGQIVATQETGIGTASNVVIVMKNLIGGQGITINTGSTDIIITNSVSRLITDPNPTLSGNLIGTSTATFRAEQFANPEADQDLVTRKFLYDNFLNRDGNYTTGVFTNTNTTASGASTLRENISLSPSTQTVYSTLTNVGKVITVVDSTGSFKTIDLTKQATSSTHITRKDYVDTKISLQGTDTIDPATGAVNAGFGTMTGPLLLSRDPVTDDDFAPFAGRIATTKAYVDRNDFYSNNNLYVTQNGKDYQPLVPPIRRGRAPQYAFATLNKAARYAERLIATSMIQVGDYARLITYDDGTPATVYDVTENFYGNNLARLRLEVGTNGSDQFGVAPVGQFKIFPGQYVQGVKSNAIALIENITKASISGEPEVYSIAYVDYADDFDTRITTSIVDGNPDRIKMTFEDDQMVPIPDFWVGYKFYTDTGVDNGIVISVGSVVDNAGTYFNSFVVEFPVGSAPGPNQVYNGRDWHVYANDFQIGETLVYNTNVSALQITFVIESGEYYEQLPIKLAANTSIRGDEFRRVVIRPADGVSSSPWAGINFRRDAQIDGLQTASLNTGTDYAVPGAIASPNDSSGVISISLSAGSLTNAVKGYIFQGNGGSGIIETVNGSIITVNVGTPLVDASPIAAGDWNIYEPIVFGRHYLRFPDLPQNNLTTELNAGGYYNAALELASNKEFIQEESVAWLNAQIAANSGNPSSIWYNYTYDQDKCRRDTGTIIDSLEFDIIHGGSEKIISFAAATSEVPSLTTGQCSLSIDHISDIAQDILLGNPITPSAGNSLATTSTELTLESGADLIVADLLQAASRIINLDPDFNPAKNNSELDVFLCNDAVVIRYISVQNQGGFMQVLDPVGQVRNKSPYTQSASSFSRSKEKQVFAGGMFVDGFSGNVEADVIDFSNPLELEVTGLRLRPQVPTFFVHRGIRYEVSFFADFLPDYVTTSTNGIAEQFYSATLRLNPLSPGGITNTVLVTDNGGGWVPLTNIPITIELPEGIGGLTASGYAVSDGSGYISDIVIDFPGTGYVGTPYISVGGAIFNNLVFSGTGITGFNIVTGGSGYTTNTTFEIIPIGVLGGVRATGQVTSVNGAGAITGVTIVTNGSGWDASVNYRVAFGDLDITVPAPSPGFIDEDVPAQIEMVTAGNRSMLANDFTQVNDLGYGIFVTNGGFMENVSMFTYYGYRSYYSLNGSQVRSLGGSSVYGEYGLVADGSDPFEVPLTITLPFSLVQIANSYVANPLFPAQTGQTFIYVEIDPTNGGYPPLNGSVIEINHNGIRKNYSVGSASPALDSSNAIIPNVYQLLFNTGNIAAGNDSIGLIADVTNGSPVIIRVGSLLKLLGFNPSSITRPSTSLVWNDDPTEVYFVTEFSPIQPDTSVLTYTASDYNYITFQTVEQGILTPTIISGGNNYSTSTTVLNITTAGLAPTTTKTVVGNQGIGTIGIQTFVISDTSNIVPGELIAGTGILAGSYVTYVNYADNIISINQPTSGAISSGTTLTFSSEPPVATLTITSGTITDITVEDGGAGWTVPSTTVSITGTGTGISIIPSVGIAGVEGSSVIKINNLDLTSENRIKSGLVASPTRYYQFALGDQVYEIIGYSSQIDLGSTWAQLEISPPLQETITQGVILRAGIPLNSKGSLTTRVSILRASGHDFVDIGTGGYATTRIPNDLYGPPLQQPSQTREVIEANKGRVFYVSTDQDGNFRVGRALTVNQNRGSVNISVPLDLSNLSSVSLRRDLGPPVNEFSIDGTMVTEADYKVPTEQAVVTYINRRLGLDRSGNVYPGSPLGPQFLALSGVLPMKGSIDMANFRITNLNTPRFGFGSDGSNKDYTDSKISNAGTAAVDTNNTTYRPQWGRMTGSLQLYNDAVVKTATVATTATSGVSSITFASLTSAGNYRPGDFLRHRVYGLGIPEGTYVGIVFADGLTLGLSTIDEVSVLTTATIPAGTVISFDPIFQAATKRTVDENRQFNKLVDVQLTNVADRDLVMFSNVIIAANSSTNPPVYTTATQLINVTNNDFVDPVNTPTGISGGSDVFFDRTGNVVTIKLIGGTVNEATNPITDFHINSFAQIKQAKLKMDFASTAPTPTIGTQTQIQNTLGLALFDSRMFTATDGWITLVDSTGTTSGVQTTKQAWVPAPGGLLGATNTAAATAATYVSSASIQTWLQNLSSDWRYSSNLTPNVDIAEDLGVTARRWGNIYASTATLDGGLVVNTLARITTNQTTAEIFTATVTTLNMGNVATTARLGGTSGTLTIGNPTVVGTQVSQDLYNTVATTMNFASAATTMRIGGTSGTLTIGNTTVVGTGASQDLYNTVATTLNIGSAATTMRIGATSGTLTVGNPTVVGTEITQNLYNTVATTMNFAGAATTANLANAATTMRIGAASGTLTIGNPTVVGTQITQNLYNTVATTINFGGAATAINMGNAAGTNTLRGTTTISVLAADGDGSQVTGAWILNPGATFQATYADLAEWYGADAEYEPGTVLVFGGDREVTTTTVSNDSRVAGVVTTDPAYIMNVRQEGTKACIALQGRVPVKVIGVVRKGDMLTTSNTVGYATKAMNPTVGTIIGKALEDKTDPGMGTIQVAIGRM